MTADEELSGRLAAILLLEDLPPIDSPKHARAAVDALLPEVKRYAAETVRDFADLIDRGPTFPMPPSIFSAMARERADALTPEGETTP